MEKIKQILAKVSAGEMAVEEAAGQIAALPVNKGFCDLGFAKVDYSREARQGLAEVIYCEGKTPKQAAAIFIKLVEKNQGTILASRANKAHYEAISEQIEDVEYYKEAKMAVLWRPSKEPVGKVLVVAAGTSDLPVAEEAAITAFAMGAKVERLYDVGVAGIHRLLAAQEVLHFARVIIVVAGMEGALASVVGGMVSVPIIAVPTSVGYGASFGGLSALLAMLNSCAPGVMVVNIDNGFGAGYAAARINSMASPTT
ncbi:MAG: nickel pincer cofactor biosynthesis protein LarB [Clostridia bacterium]|jgi:hypothetical protein|nr:nickel pincer cofactor biosynthesis protein LarB [Clostridia bacterium]MDD4572373.1 nickel pincer cofactor biosynthesis protein LarB [Clostridia bacterium]